ncbi:MAG: hypothetical protein ACD_69C00178G0001, partial [uncultured bacterium]
MKKIMHYTNYAVWLLILSFISIYFLFTTEYGLIFSCYLIKKITFGKVEMLYPTGTLSENFSIKEFTLNTQHLHLSANNIDIIWSPRQLLHGVLLIKSISVDNLTVIPIKSGSINNPGTNNNNLKWIKYIDAENINFYSIHIKENTINAHITRLTSLKQRNSERFVLIEFQSGKIYGHFKGITNKNGNASWNIYIPNIKSFIPNIQGSIYSQGTIIIENYQPKAAGILQGNHISFEKIKLPKINGEITSSENSINLNCIINNLSINDYLLPLTKINITSQLIKKDLSTLFSIFLPGINQIDGHIILSKFLDEPSITQPLNGNIYIYFPHLDSLFKPTHIKNTQGILH